MPIYRFKCEKCESEYEDLVAHRGDISPCPECGCEKVERMITAPAPHISKDSGKLPSCSDGSCEFINKCPNSRFCGM